MEIDTRKTELLYSVKEIFSDYLKNSQYEYFNIPDYQRGYKWNASDATKLLDDLKEFEESNPKDGDFYCLQNITLVPSDNGKSLNVVDGQQRLTTLYILLSFYKNCKKQSLGFSENILKYSIKGREKTAEKLIGLYQDIKFWNALNPAAAEHRDEFYILTVAKAIYDWFFCQKEDEGKREEKNHLEFDTVWNKLKLIVNKVEGKTEETIFANINGGKVPLDGADLVRAILMTKSAKEKFSELKSTEKTNEFRVRMGIEIDGINQWWSNEDVKAYYAQFISGTIQNDDLFKKDFPINLLYKIFYEIYKDKIYKKDNVKKNEEKKKIFSFDFFEYGTDFDGKGGNNYYEMYQEILSLHLTLKDWYNNSEIYHLLGYLFFNFKEPVSLGKVWKEWEASNSKHEFTERLRNIISDNLEDLVGEEVDDKDQNHSRRKELLRQIEDINSDWYGNAATEKLLPLMDVIHYVNTQKGRLPVGYFKKADEQKEHIMCQHPRKTDEGQKLTSKEAFGFIETLCFSEEDEEIHNELLKLVKKSSAADELTSEAIEEFEKKLHDYCLNSIGNIVLLNSSINESYGNAPHNEKVARITSELFGSRCYIRPFTAGVFLEKDTTQVNEKWHWGIFEIRRNANEISKEISNFLGWEK